MNRLKCLTVDDELGAHLVIKNYISRFERLELVGQCFSALEAINFLHKTRVDILFLDITMPEMTGFDMLASLPNTPKVVLTTAHSDYALEGFEHGASDYLIKPIPFTRFLKAVNRLIAAADEVPATIPADKYVINNFLFLPVDGEQVRLDFDQILYVQSWGNYVKVFTKNNTLLASMTTFELENQLPANAFLRIHKSYVVAIAAISKISGNRVFVDKIALPIGTTYKQKVLDRVRER
jgi:DNA-binding LytR/AlgR family response regulator